MSKRKTITSSGRAVGQNPPQLGIYPPAVFIIHVVAGLVCLELLTRQHLVSFSVHEVPPLVLVAISLLTVIEYYRVTSQFARFFAKQFLDPLILACSVVGLQGFAEVAVSAKQESMSWSIAWMTAFWVAGAIRYWLHAHRTEDATKLTLNLKQLSLKEGPTVGPQFWAHVCGVVLCIFYLVVYNDIKDESRLTYLLVLTLIGAVLSILYLVAVFRVEQKGA